MHPQGSVLLVKEVPDPQGANPKTRPVVALAFQDDELYGVGITTTFSHPLHPCEVELAYSRKGHCYTGLHEPSVASTDAIVKKLGFVGDKELAEILKRVVNLANGRPC